MLKGMTVGLLLAGAVLGAADTASAQQTFNFNIGYLAVKGQDARVGASCTNCGRDVDVLLADHDFLTFDFKDFNGASIGGEWDAQCRSGEPHYGASVLAEAAIIFGS